MVKPTRFTQDMIDRYFSTGYWKRELTSEIWDRNAELYPDKEALVDSRSRLTWSQVKQRSDRIALGLLELGFKKNELVFMLVPNCCDSYVIRLACEKAGILCMTALMTIRENEIEHILRQYEVSGLVIPWKFRKFDYYGAVDQMRPALPALRHVLVTGDDVPPGAESLEEVVRSALETRYPKDYFRNTRFQPSDVVVVATTSGTTGMPKACEHIAAARVAVTDAHHQVVRLTRDDVILNAINAVGGLGAYFCYSSPRTAAKSVMLEIWNAEEALKLIERERATILLLAPAQLAMILNHPELRNHDHTSLRVICCTTAPLGYELAIAAEETLGVPVLNRFGTLDSGPICAVPIDADAETRRRTVGKPLPGNEVKLVDERGVEVAPGEIGELYWRGPYSTGGYYRDVGKTEEAWGELGENGWFRTGDLARFDRDGNIVITGRKKDVIIRGGQNIYPAEIETLLLTHPDVRQVALVPMPDPIMGEKACAYVAPREGRQFTFEEMISFLKSKKIAPYKLPERLEVRDELPLRGGEQKVAKSELREDIIRKIAKERGAPTTGSQGGMKSDR